jgi:hypothetical protein
MYLMYAAGLQQALAACMCVCGGGGIEKQTWQAQTHAHAGQHSPSVARTHVEEHGSVRMQVQVLLTRIQDPHHAPACEAATESSATDFVGADLGLCSAWGKGTEAAGTQGERKGASAHMHASVTVGKLDHMDLTPTNCSRL